MHKDKKVCRICNIEKDVSEYRLDRGAVYSRCKECCSKEAKLLRSIKKSAPEKPDNERCQCCGQLTSKWYCDHDHKTLKFRGWVCFNCNQGIGFLGDNLIGVTKALYYLTKRKICESIWHKWKRIYLESF
jgi:hypothetical protein